MREKGHYSTNLYNHYPHSKHSGDDEKDRSVQNFTFEEFLLTLQIIATHGFKNVKEDLNMRIPKLFKHMHKIMSMNDKFNEDMNTSKSMMSKSRSPGGTKERTTGESKRVIKEGTDGYLMSNRSGGSAKSSHGRKGSNQMRKSKKRRSSNQKRRLK